MKVIIRGTVAQLLFGCLFGKHQWVYLESPTRVMRWCRVCSKPQGPIEK